jgi:RHS repeat-associated protein
VLYDQINNYLYDPEGRLCAVSYFNGTTTEYMLYLYDGEGWRVAKVSNPTFSCTPGTGSTLMETYLLGPSGEHITELGQTGAFLRSNVYANGRLLATYTNDGTYFSLSDWLGSKRVVTKYDGTVAQMCMNLPFGDELMCSATDLSEHHFTGQIHDQESGNDYFNARYYSNYTGRFMSPDPAGMQAPDLEFPQSLNRYAYVWNNPLSFTDPTGLDCAYLNDAGTGLEKGGLDQSSSSGECGRTGGYWVEGGLTNLSVNADQGSVQLTGTTNGTDQTHASYQDSTAFVGMYQNNDINPFGHIAIGIGNQIPVGLNPASDLNFLMYATYGGKSGGVGGVVKPQGPKGLKKFVRVPVTGMQAKMIQDQLNRAMQNAPNYDIFGGGGPACDCAGFAQQMLGDAGINSGPPTDIPSTLMQQLGSQYPQQ